MHYSDFQFWLVPAVIALIWLIYLSGKILMVPMRWIFHLSLLALPVWAALNWNWLRAYFHH